MSYSVFFSFSRGLSKDLRAPAGTKQRILAQVAKTERTLSIKRTKYLDNPAHWDNFDPEFRDGFPSVSDEVLCAIAAEHNEFVRSLYVDMGKWAESPVEGGDTITPQDAAEFWPGLEMIDVPPERWTKDYYRAEAEHLYEVMRGRENRGVDFDSKPLTERQTAAVLNLIGNYLDRWDLRLDVPNGCDFLASSADGGYDWCEKCGPVLPEDGDGCRKRGCPLRAEREATA